MQDTNALRDRMVSEFAENYMEQLFYFCLKKTGHPVEAEDLTQDIALQIIMALNKGRVPTSFSAWIWQIARNRYAAWAKEKHRRSEAQSASDIGDYEIEDKRGNIIDEMIQTEQLALLRRELAFIKSDYRDIIVAHYLENKSVREMAEALSLSTNTVKSRLLRARKILKEGMDMAREFGKRSYHPEQVAFCQNGKDGKKGQPWSIITHLLYKNIFLETHENPQTAEALSLELGIALPYMEDELEYLVREQLLQKIGDSYQTAFPIIRKEEQRKTYEQNKTVQKALTDKLCTLVDTYIREDGARVNYRYIGYAAAKWTLLVRTFDMLQHAAPKAGGTAAAGQSTCPPRPDDGAWTLTGYEVIDWKEPAFVGQNGYITYDENEVKEEINFAQFKFFFGNMQAKTPTHLSWAETYTLWLVCRGRIAECERGYLDKLLEYGYLKEAGEIVPNLVIFDRSAERRCSTEQAGKMAVLREEICALLKQAPDIARGYVVEQAIADGWLQYDDSTIPTVGAYIYL